MKTVYFSGSISGGREDRAMYRRIVDALEVAGHRVYAGAVTSESIDAAGEPLEALHILERDLAWIEEVAGAGGVLVAEVSRPSVGVGYEIAAARYRFNMPVICLYRPAFTTRCSGMIAGDRDIQLIEYSDDVLDGAIDQLIRLLGE
jgi:2'-deoxynucleoside 5'-phosphate N-hydrolase